MAKWNPWHGCQKISEGCQNCYVYRIDSRNNRDASVPHQTADFLLPIKTNRCGKYKINSGELVYTCFTSDFFLPAADAWRERAWQIMRKRSDVNFLLATKRINRFTQCLPQDWGEGYPNVEICCTVENQKRADERLPIFLELPIFKKSILCEPLLEKVNLTDYLNSGIKEVVAGGESGPAARICKYDWILDLHKQCSEKCVPFRFKQTGANFEKDGKIYFIKRENQEVQAQKAGIDLHF